MIKKIWVMFMTWIAKLFDTESEHVISWVKRNPMIIGIGILALFFLGFKQEYLTLVLLAVFLKMLATMISQFDVWAFTRMNFLSTDNANYQIIVAAIYKSDTMLIAMIVVAYYFYQTVKDFLPDAANMIAKALLEFVQQGAGG